MKYHKYSYSTPNYFSKQCSIISSQPLTFIYFCIVSFLICPRLPHLPRSLSVCPCVCLSCGYVKLRLMPYLYHRLHTFAPNCTTKFKEVVSSLLRTSLLTPNNNTSLSLSLSVCVSVCVCQLGIHTSTGITCVAIYLVVVIFLDFQLVAQCMLSV